MEQNENIMDNNFENFEEQGKYKSLTLKKQKKADFCAKISVVIVLLCLLILIIEGAVGFTLRYETSIGISITYLDILVIILYCIATIFAVIGFWIKRTNLTKALFIFTVVLPVSIVASAISMYIILYVLFYPLIQLAWSSI